MYFNSLCFQLFSPDISSCGWDTLSVFLSSDWDWDLGPGTWGLGPGTWDLGPGTWDLGPGTWDTYIPIP